MIPASNIGKHNYNTLGNQLVGETHASRMKRVNAAQMQPMGAIIPDPGAAADAAFYGVGGGFMGALLLIEAIFQIRRSDVSKNRKTGAVGICLGAGAVSLCERSKTTTTKAKVQTQ